jgi:hypothetical protein
MQGQVFEREQQFDSYDLIFKMDGPSRGAKSLGATYMGVVRKLQI